MEVNDLKQICIGAANIARGNSIGDKTTAVLAGILVWKTLEIEAPQNLKELLLEAGKRDQA